MSVIGPLGQIDGIIIDAFKSGGGKLGTLGYDIGAEEILDTLRSHNDR